MIIDNKKKVDEYEPGKYRHGGRTSDRIKEEIDDTKSNRIDIASAFFSNPIFINELIDVYEVRKIRLIVRLNTGTNPEALREFINRPGIQVRFFFATTFHPKFYILKKNENINTAFVGSANLTISGMTRNDEVAVKVDDENDLQHLSNIFTSYWEHEDARPLTELELNKFIESAEEKGGWKGPSNGYGDGVKVDDNLIRYMQEFQDWNYKFNNIKEKYKLVIGNNRKVPDVPLSIEIDEFFSFIYKRNKRNGVEPTADFENDVIEWIRDEDKLDIIQRYQVITDGFSSEELQNNRQTKDDLTDSIYMLHSPDDRNRNNFFNNNKLSTVKDNINYLLYGDDVEENQYKRMYDLININSERHIHNLGESSIQELVGWFKFDSGLPIRNRRSENVMSFYLSVAENN
jgi:HKD family nuclease